MKIVLFGASGQLGSDIQKRVGERGIDLHSYDLPSTDITDFGQVSSILGGVKPDVVINAAAYTDVDKAESDEQRAFAVNADGPRNIARAARTQNQHVIHLSTDYVFNGENTRPWKENDPLSPLGAYGRSKLAGERALLEELPSALVVRTAWLHGSNGKNFLQTMIKLFIEREEVRVVDDQIGNPTWSGWLAHVLLDLAKTKSSGILHASCAGEVSWFGFAEEIRRQASVALQNAKLKRLLPQNSLALNRPAPRPQYSSLDCTKLEKILGRPCMSWQAGVLGHLRELSLAE